MHDSLTFITFPTRVFRTFRISLEADSMLHSGGHSVGSKESRSTPGKELCVRIHRTVPSSSGSFATALCCAGLRIKQKKEVEIQGVVCY